MPHHTSWTGTDWQAADERIQRLFEVVSVHGASEHLDNLPIPSRGAMQGMFAVDGLRRGLRFGFVGGSDAHGLLWHHGLGRKRDPWTCGLTGVYATAGDRGSLFDALYARRTFATSGERISVFLRAGGVPMGGEGRVEAPVHFEISVDGGSPKKRVFVIRDGRVIREKEFVSESLTMDDADAEVGPGRHSYYVRVITGEGDRAEVAWSSPVFVTVEKPQKAGRRSGR